MERNNIWDKNWKKGLVPDVHPELLDIITKHINGTKILEIGFGSGGDLCALSSKGFSCFGIENSKVAFDNSKRYKKIKTFFGNGEETPFNDSEFDLIFHQGVMEHFKNPRKIMSESWRILKDGGVIVADVPHKWNLFTIYKNIFQIFGKWYGGWERSYSKNELENLARKNEFKTLKIYYRGIWPHQWGKFLFPEKIIKNKVTKKILTVTPIKHFQIFVRKIYENSHLLRVVSSYNIIMVAKKV